MAQATVGFLDSNGNWVPVSSGNALPTSSGSGEDTVTSVNGQTGEVTLDAEDVNALPDTYTPPAPTWASVTGKPTTFPPSTHTHAIADVTGLQSILTDLENRVAALEVPPEA